MLQQSTTPLRAELDILIKHLATTYPQLITATDLNSTHQAFKDCGTTRNGCRLYNVLLEPGSGTFLLHSLDTWSNLANCQLAPTN